MSHNTSGIPYLTSHLQNQPSPLFEPGVQWDSWVCTSIAISSEGLEALLSEEQHDLISHRASQLQWWGACGGPCGESEAVPNSWTLSAVAQLPFIDSTMSQKASVHMVPKITSNQQNSQPFYSVASLERLSLGQIPFFPSIIPVLLHWS